MRIYIAGPIRGTDDYMMRFRCAEENLQDRGYEVINPAAVCARLPELTHNEYMSICLPMVALCDAIYLLKGWIKSEGANAELRRALQNQIEVIEE